MSEEPKSENCPSGLMTLRDYFAAKAMQADIASRVQGEGLNRHECARFAYKMADSMLKERSRG